MRLAMAGLDHTTAGVDVRGAFAPDAASLKNTLRRIADALPPSAGCALVATCNRTELYVSHPAGDAPDCVAALCGGFGENAAGRRAHFVERREDSAAAHLMRVAAGLRSGVPGDSQVISQVRAAADAARDAGTADPLISALFRAAVAAGKRIRTSVSFARDNASVAGNAVREIVRRLAPDAHANGKRALVVGNGAVGILAAQGLRDAGFDVAMTLRDVRRKIDLPRGCRIVDYAARHGAVDGCDVVVSATSAGGFVLAAEDLAAVRVLPGLFVDLAVPRDIDPAVADRGAVVLTVDDLRAEGGADGSAGSAAAARADIAKAEEIVREEAERFALWRRNRRRYAGVARRSADGEAGADGEEDAGTPDFPVFINLHGAAVLLAGGGKVAARRAEKLLAAGARVHVVSPEISREMEKLLECGGGGALRWTRAEYSTRHIAGSTLAIAATDNRDVNRRVGEDARAHGILVSVADRREECTFYFPAIVRSDCLTAGLVSNNGDHALVRRAAARLRTEMEILDADNQSGQPRK